MTNCFPMDANPCIGFCDPLAGHGIYGEIYVPFEMPTGHHCCHSGGSKSRSRSSDWGSCPLAQNPAALQVMPYSTLAYPCHPAGFVTLVATPLGQATPYYENPGTNWTCGQFYAPVELGPPGQRRCYSGSRTRSSPRSKRLPLASFPSNRVLPERHEAMELQTTAVYDRKPSAGHDADLCAKKRYQRGGYRQHELKRSRLESNSGISPVVPRPMAETPGKIDFAKASIVIKEYFDANRQVEEVYCEKIKLRDSLFGVMKCIFPYCGLYVIGSSMNGFGGSSSDVDLCLMLSHSEIDQKNGATKILQFLNKALSACDFVDSLKLIHAKVPILKFKAKHSNIDCDLNINNSVGIRNTHLLKAYSTMDSRIAQLVLFVKRWAKTQSINDASQGTISSYSLVLMVLHYLQHGCKPNVIPSLQQKYPHKFDGSVDIRTLSLNERLAPYQSANRQCVGELFVGFLGYYANDFKFDEDVISVRLGRTIPQSAIHESGSYHFYSTQWKCLCIEEPFNLTNTAYSVFDRSSFQRIRNVIQRSFRVVRDSGNIDSLISDPLCGDV